MITELARGAVETTWRAFPPSGHARTRYIGRLSGQRGCQDRRGVPRVRWGGGVGGSPHAVRGAYGAGGNTDLADSRARVFGGGEGRESVDSTLPPGVSGAGALIARLTAGYCRDMRPVGGESKSPVTLGRRGAGYWLHDITHAYFIGTYGSGVPGRIGGSFLSDTM